MSPDHPALEDLLYRNDLGDEAEGAGLNEGREERAAAGAVSFTFFCFPAQLFHILLLLVSLCLFFSDACRRLRPGVDGVRRLRRAGVRPFLPAGCGPGVARCLPALQPVSLRVTDTPFAFLEGREHLLPTGLRQVRGDISPQT